MGASTQLHVPQCIIKLFIASGYMMIPCWISASSFTLEMLTFRRSLQMRLNKDHCLRPVTPVHCQWHLPSLRSFDSYLPCPYDFPQQIATVTIRLIEAHWRMTKHLLVLTLPMLLRRPPTLAPSQGVTLPV